MKSVYAIYQKTKKKSQNVKQSTKREENNKASKFNYTLKVYQKIETINNMKHIDILHTSPVPLLSLNIKYFLYSSYVCVCKIFPTQKRSVYVAEHAAHFFGGYILNKGRQTYSI